MINEQSIDPAIQAIKATLEASGISPDPQKITITLIKTVQDLLTTDSIKAQTFLKSMHKIDCNDYGEEITSMLNITEDPEILNLILPIIRSINTDLAVEGIEKLFYLNTLNSCTIESKKLIMKLLSRNPNIIFNRNINLNHSIHFTLNNTFFVLKHVFIVDLIKHFSCSPDVFNFLRVAYACLNQAFQRKFMHIYATQTTLLQKTEHNKKPDDIDRTDSSIKNDILPSYIDSHPSDKQKMLLDLFDIVIPKVVFSQETALIVAKIYALFMNYDRLRIYQNKTPIFVIRDICEFCLRILDIEADNKHNDLEDGLKNLVLASSHLIQTQLLSFVDALVQVYYKHGKKTHGDILKIILRISGPEMIYSLIKKNSLEFLNFVNLFKKINNVDLSFLRTLYMNENPDIFFELCVNCCNYCTDKEQNAQAICEIFTNAFNSDNTKHIIHVSRAIKNILLSHTHYASNNIVLVNPIKANESKIILNNFCSLPMIESILSYLFLGSQKYTDSTSFLRDIIQIIIRVFPQFHNSFKTDQIVIAYKNLRLGCEKSDFGKIGLISLCKNTSDLLKMMILISENLYFDYEMVCKTFSILRNSKQAVRKYAYELLIKILKENKTDICICEYIYVDETKNIPTCSQKISLMSISLLSCKNCIYKQDNFFTEYVIDETIRASRDPCNKTRKAAFENMYNIAKEKFYCCVKQRLLKHINGEDLFMIHGSIVCLQIFFYMTQFNIDEDVELQKIISTLHLKSPEFHRSILELYKRVILNASEESEIQKYFDLITKMSHNCCKKMAKALKSFNTDMKKAGIKIPNELYRFSKMKHRQNEKITYNFTKKGVVELSKKKLIFHSESEDE